MADKPRSLFESPFTETLFELTVAALREKGELEFLRSMEGSTFRTAFDPKDGVWFLIVDGRDSPVRFTEDLVKAAMSARPKPPIHWPAWPASRAAATGALIGDVERHAAGRGWTRM